MTPAMCQVKHDPPNSYGDCLRAAIATVMDRPAEDVPHFHHDGPSGPVAMQRVRDWLAPQGFTIVAFALPASPIEDVTEWMGEQNPNATYLLLGSQGPTGGDHVCVYQGGKMVHDPGWIPNRVKEVGSSGYWEIWVVAKL